MEKIACDKGSGVCSCEFMANIPRKEHIAGNSFVVGSKMVVFWFGLMLSGGAFVERIFFFIHEKFKTEIVRPAKQL